jgi:protein-tyrosine phosphatase
VFNDEMLCGEESIKGERCWLARRSAAKVGYWLARRSAAKVGYEMYLREMRILMVCLGNICRSPLAEGILQDKARRAGLNWIVESAGTESYHIGEAPHALSQKVARLNGIEICDQRARRFTAQDFDNYDKIYALAADVLDEMKRISGKKFDAGKADLLLNELYPGKNKDVPDPWYGPEQGYHEVFELLEKACDAVVKKYQLAISNRQ